jgi:D-sedoheptulose 7-phosphate isomerase
MLSKPASSGAAQRIAASLQARNPVVQAFFSSEALRLAYAAQEMAARFGRGGRLYAFGRGPYATDAAHISVEFVHPVIVGKRAFGPRVG